MFKWRRFYGSQGQVCGHSPKAAIDKECVQLCANSPLQNQTVGGLHLPAKFLPKLTPYKNKIKQEAHVEPEICLLSESTVARHLWIMVFLGSTPQRDLWSMHGVLPNDEAQETHHMKSLNTLI